MEGTQSETENSVESITPEQLNAQISDGDGAFILDVRSADNFDEWHIEGPNVESLNYPYFELLDGIPDDLLAQLPEDRTITVLCAKGGSSEMIAESIQEEGFDVNHLERGMKGWARIYEYDELDVDVAATVAQYRRPSSGCLAYLVASDGEAAVIDPLRAFTDEYVQDARALGTDLTYALDTHVHADHISGIRTLSEQTDATAVLPAPAVARGVEYDVPFEQVADGDTLSVGNVDIEVIHTPGHTSGMTAYKVGDVLFTGDGLFTESVARPDLEDPEAATDAARTLYTSLTEKVLPLPDETVVAPAHFSDAATPNDDATYTAELGTLTETMDALAMDEDEFIEFIVADMPPRPANYEEIIATNLGLESLDDEKAFELELGPNNCAASNGALTN
ncbi:Zn-dependent hydrolase [Halogeometricum borinquense DSM 11551]|uniref:Zn-dependent hydrolase n=2 Tax=Halogeometricum borinquense TaxID=60847 RepID=E4NV00_HALBP|nr:MBL fold metallo-hydrolase [Halogeometricum borinquense]ADQ68989.1 Zn-dependent hydrolase, glyoxylase [Halogeometricum borinquense DSM 11551]ELY29188.1 Zn-dependent hydrolase [Halogeometricum borinquense DSM 11551]RYJ08174.1 MBL fold metallo-hydrolase [Halogeometricum borinquense]